MAWCNEGLAATRLDPNLDGGGSTDRGRGSRLGDLEAGVGHSVGSGSEEPTLHPDSDLSYT